MGTFVNTNDRLQGRKPPLFPAGGEVVFQADSLDLATGDLDQGDLGAITILPASCKLAGITLWATDMDTGTPALVFDVGLPNSDASDLDSTLLAGSDVGKAGTAGYYVTPAILNLAVSDVDRLIYVKVATAAATKAAGTLSIGLHFYAA